MYQTIADLQVPYIIMHIQGTPEIMQDNPQYENVVNEVLFSLSEQVGKLRRMGIADIIIDPGFGFGKTLVHNYDLLAALPLMQVTGTPLLAGVSRKSMVNKVLNIKPEQALNGTTALHVMALERGASILRVHDVREAVEAVKIVSFAKAAQ